MYQSGNYSAEYDDISKFQNHKISKMVSIELQLYTNYDFNFDGFQAKVQCLFTLSAVHTDKNPS